MVLKRFALFMLISVCIVAYPALAQDQPTYLSLRMTTTALQTGQEYPVAIQVDGVPELWMANAVIQYDPNMIYVMGTKSGSPARLGSFFTPGSSMMIRNMVEDNRIDFMASQLAPASLLSGSGELGTFRIYPLAPGTTTLRFYDARLTTLTFSGEGEDRVASDPEPVPFTPVLLELIITGDPVEPPSEATATPTLTPTPLLGEGLGGATQAGPGLENVTLAPTTPTPTAAAETTPPEQKSETDSSSTVIVVGIILAGVLLMIGVALLRRSRR